MEEPNFITKYLLEIIGVLVVALTTLAAYIGRKNNTVVVYATKEDQVQLMARIDRGFDSVEKDIHELRIRVDTLHDKP